MKRRINKLILTAALATLLVSGGLFADEPVFDPNFHIYLLIGQSNMEGAPRAEAADLVEDPRIKVLAYQNNVRLGRKYNEWAVAKPPLHSHYQGVGPGDYFAKTLIKKMPANVTIGLVPLGINGVDIDFFLKGVVSTRRAEFKIPPDNAWDGAYDWVISRAKEAQKYGVIKGILFHQGESDSGKRNWQAKVKKMVEALRADLNIPDAPIIIGEMMHGGGAESHNLIVANTVKSTPNAWLVTTEGLAGQDRWHFNLEAQRELGRRYALKMMEALGIE